MKKMATEAVCRGADTQIHHCLRQSETDLRRTPDGEYRIEVIDLLVNPQLAKGDQILALPTLVRKLPEPMKKIIGDLSNTERVLVGLDIKPLK